MNESVITGIFALSGTILGGLISYLIARNGKELKTLKSQVNILSNQIISIMVPFFRTTKLKI